MSQTQQDLPTGTENPRGPAGPDAPTPPGGPQRTDAPGAVGDAAPPVTEPEPTPDAQPDPEPQVHPSGDPGPSPSTAPTPAAPQPQPDAPDGEIHARSQTELANEQLQRENAETSLDQPSDG
jgi:hypothetical protein